MSDKFFDDMFSNAPVMAILRGLGLARTLELAHLAWDMGITSVEVPIQSDTDLQSLRAVAAARRKPTKIGFPLQHQPTGGFRLRAMSGPFPHTRFVSTGGMDAHNAQAFLDAGARVVAVGSALEDPR